MQDENLSFAPAFVSRSGGRCSRAPKDGRMEWTHGMAYYYVILRILHTDLMSVTIRSLLTTQDGT